MTNPSPKVAIIIPPLSNSTFNLLGPLLLNDFLRKNKIKVDNINLNKEILNYALSKNVLKKKISMIKEQIKKEKSQENIQYLNYISGILNHTQKNCSFFKKRMEGNQSLINALFDIVTFDINLYYVRDDLFSDEEIKNFLKQPKGKVKLLEETLIKLVKRKKIHKKYDFIGISIPHGDLLVYSLLTAKIIKKLNKKIHIGLGGSAITLTPNNSLEYWKRKGIIDSYTKFEGEISLMNIFKKLWPKKIKFKGKQGIDINSRLINYLPYARKKQNFVPILHSQGCYYNKCTYCTCKKLYSDNLLKIKKPEKLIKEIKNLHNKYGKKAFLLINESLHPNQAKKISELILKYKLKITWLSYLRIDNNFSLDILKKMSSSGFQGILGMESANNRILCLMKKGYTKKDIRIFLDNCAKTNLRINQLNIISNFPSTSFKEALETINFLKKFKKIINYVALQFFGLDVNSEIWRNLSKYEIEPIYPIKKNGGRNMMNTINYKDPKGMSKKELNKIQQLYSQFNKELGRDFMYPGILDNIKNIYSWNQLKEDLKCKLSKKRFVLMKLQAKSMTPFNFVDLYSRKFYRVDNSFLKIFKKMPDDKFFSISSFIEESCNPKSTWKTIKYMIENVFFENIKVNNKKPNGLKNV